MERWDRTKLEYLFSDFLKEYAELKEENQKLKEENKKLKEENEQLAEELNTSNELDDTIDELDSIIEDSKKSLGKLILNIDTYKKRDLLVIRDELVEIKRGLDLC
jgi:hypothetical protein